MPSLQDVADQINAKLDQITNNTAATFTAVQGVDATTQAGFATLHGDLQAVENRITAVGATLHADLLNLGHGLFAVLEVQRSALAELTHHSAQNATIICLLENANELLCGMTRKMTDQLTIAAATAESVDRLEGIAERVHSAEAADFDRQAAIKAELAACCPPDEPEPERCPDSCPVPKHRPRRPDGQDWTPVRDRQPEG